MTTEAPPTTDPPSVPEPNQRPAADPAPVGGTGRQAGRGLRWATVAMIAPYAIAIASTLIAAGTRSRAGLTFLTTAPLVALGTGAAWLIVLAMNGRREVGPDGEQHRRRRLGSRGLLGALIRTRTWPGPAQGAVAAVIVYLIGGGLALAFDDELPAPWSFTW